MNPVNFKFLAPNIIQSKVVKLGGYVALASYRWFNEEVYIYFPDYYLDENNKIVIESDKLNYIEKAIVQMNRNKRYYVPVPNMYKDQTVLIRLAHVKRCLCGCNQIFYPKDLNAEYINKHYVNVLNSKR